MQRIIYRPMEHKGCVRTLQSLARQQAAHVAEYPPYLRQQQLSILGLWWPNLGPIHIKEGHIMVGNTRMTPNEALYEAALQGYIGLMFLFREWGADNIDWAMYTAAGGGHENREW